MGSATSLLERADRLDHLPPPVGVVAVAGRRLELRLEVAQDIGGFGWPRNASFSPRWTVQGVREPFTTFW